MINFYPTQFRQIYSAIQCHAFHTL